MPCIYIFRDLAYEVLRVWINESTRLGCPEDLQVQVGFTLVGRKRA